MLINLYNSEPDFVCYAVCINPHLFSLWTFITALYY